MNSLTNVFLINIVVFSLFRFSSTSVDSNSITLSLSRPTTAAAKWEELNRLAIASSARSQHPTTINDPLFARSYGGYSIDLSFGTPAQTLSFVMDTGSSLVWFPCTLNFTCNMCNFDGVETIPAFLPESSSSSKNVSCNTQQCKRVHPNDSSSPNCTSGPCPGYEYIYGVGNTTGSFLSETLTFPMTRFDNFLAGCSMYASGAPSGIVGFGPQPYSLPSQFGVDSFSYCMVSRVFDDNSTVSSDLVLTKGDDKGAAPEGILYTPFIKNPVFQEYYYVSLRKITVGLVDVVVPNEYHSPDSTGNGGTIVDSGTTFTMMDESVLGSVSKEIEKHVGKNYIRNTTVENMTGLGLCYNVLGDESFKHIPNLSFHFEGGALMDLPLENYFINAGLGDSFGCMTMAAMSIPEGFLGPAIILGNYLQQNFYIEYDLRNNRLGLHKQEC